MELQRWTAFFFQEVAATSATEWVAVAAGVAEVLLARRNKVWLYPAGIISVLLYIYLNINWGLYAEAVLSVYYLVMSIYGWVLWVGRKGGVPLAITKSSGKEWLIAAAIVGVGWGVFYWALSHYTDSKVPFWDAWVAATAWAGMWLLARRKLENWLVLNLSNLFAIPLYLYKEKPMTASLTVFLFVVAIFGYLGWKKQMAVADATQQEE